MRSQRGGGGGGGVGGVCVWGGGGGGSILLFRMKCVLHNIELTDNGESANLNSLEVHCQDH